MRRSGGRLREQVCGGGRRRLGRVRPHRLAGQPEVSEDLLHDSGILDRRQQAHPVPAPGTREHVDVEGPPHQVGPRRADRGGPPVSSAEASGQSGEQENFELEVELADDATRHGIARQRLDHVRTWCRDGRRRWPLKNR